MAEHEHHPPVTTLYGGSIHEARRSGDVGRMQDMARHAQEYLDSLPGVRSALEELRSEIKRAGGNS